MSIQLHHGKLLEDGWRTMLEWVADFVSVGEGGFATVRTRIIGPYDRTLDLPLLVGSSAFFPFLLSRKGRFLVCFSPPFQRRKFLTT